MKLLLQEFRDIKTMIEAAEVYLQGLMVGLEALSKIDNTEQHRVELLEDVAAVMEEKNKLESELTQKSAEIMKIRIGA